MPETNNALEKADQVPAGRQFSFHLEEYKTLRDEIARLDRAKRQFEVFTITAIAIITSWLFLNEEVIEKLRMTIMWWTPLVVAMLGYLQARAYVRGSYRVGE